MGSASQNRQAVCRGGGSRILPQPQKLLPRFIGAAMGFGRDLDLCLQEFPTDPADGAELGSAEQCVGCLRRRLASLRIGQKIFFLNAELKQVVGPEGARFPARRDERAEPETPLARIEFEFHGQVPFAQCRSLNAIGFDVCGVKCLASATSTQAALPARVSNDLWA